MAQGTTASSLTGSNGGVVLSASDTIAAVTGASVTGRPYARIVCLTACTFANLDSNLTNEADAEGVAIAAGVELWGQFGNVSLTSGNCIVYLR